MNDRMDWAELLDHLCDPHGHAQDREQVSSCGKGDVFHRREAADDRHAQLHKAQVRGEDGSKDA